MHVCMRMREVVHFAVIFKVFFVTRTTIAFTHRRM